MTANNDHSRSLNRAAPVDSSIETPHSLGHTCTSFSAAPVAIAGNHADFPVTAGLFGAKTPNPGFPPRQDTPEWQSVEHVGGRCCMADVVVLGASLAGPRPPRPPRQALVPGLSFWIATRHRWG